MLIRQEEPSPRALVAGACSAALVLVVAGCGGSSKVSKADCRADAIHSAEAQIVARAYADGKLGSRAQVQHALGARFFTKDGRLRSYASLTSPQERGEFDVWMSHDPKVLAATLDERNAAMPQIVARAHEQCG